MNQQVVAGGPNIVVIMVDDQPLLPNEFYARLPNINSLFLQQGIRFTNNWGNFALCCPGRANLLTGQYAHHHGVNRNVGTLFDPRETIATELRSVGYYTAICGKYFNGFSQIADKTPVGWDDVAVKDEGAYFNYSAWVNGVKEFHGSDAADYSTDVMAGHCLRFLDDAPPSKPLFVLMSPNATHGGWDENHNKDGKMPVAAPRHRGDVRCNGVAPWRPASYNEADVSDKPAYIQRNPLLGNSNGWPLLKSCETMLSVDEWLGDTIATLQQQGRYNNTIFVLTADNGMGWGAHRWKAKTAPHTAQVPLFVSWPGAGTTRSDQQSLVSNIDLAPTLCELAGCVMGPYANGFGVDGQSFAGLITAKSSPAFDRDATVIEGRGSGVPRFRAIITSSDHQRGPWLFVTYPSITERELYDLSGGPCLDWQIGDDGDPCMMSNVADAPPYRDLQKALRLQLERMW